jgi:hypothetical protein
MQANTGTFKREDRVAAADMIVPPAVNRRRQAYDELFDCGVVNVQCSAVTAIESPSHGPRTESKHQAVEQSS